MRALPEGKIHVVKPAGKRIQPEVSVDPANTRIVCGSFVADVLIDRLNPTVFHWVVQRFGSPDILHWSQENTFEEAERAAEAYVNRLARQEAQAAKAKGTAIGD